MTSKTEQQHDDQIKKTGRGFLVITAAKVWFLITGALIQLGLPIFLGSAESFGVFKIVTESMSLLNMVMITGTLQAVSKLVSEQPQRATHAVNLALKLQLVLGVPLAVGYAIAAPWVAEVFNDPGLTSFIRLSSLIVFFYAFYAIFVGYLNGLKEFVKQATLDISFATLKTAGILILVGVGLGVYGAIIGFVIAAAVICVASAIWTYIVMKGRKAISSDEGSAQLVENKEDSGRLRRLFKYLILFMIYTVALNAVMRSDLFVLKSVASSVPEKLTTVPHIAEIFTTISNKFAGFYGAVLNLARIPYQGIIAITFVIFPMISEATFRDDIETTRTYISTTLRYCTLLIVSVAILLATNADSIIGVLYSSDYQAAAEALAILSLSIIFFALLYVCMTIMLSAGRAIAAVVIMLATFVSSAVLNIIFIRNVHSEFMGGFVDHVLALPSTEAGVGKNAYDSVVYATLVAQRHVEIAAPYLMSGPQYMVAASQATSIAMALGCFTGLGYIYIRYRATLPVGTLIRVIVGAIVVWGLDLALQIPPDWIADLSRVKMLAVVAVKMGILGLAFVAALILTGEFNKTDLNRLKKVFGRQ